MARKMPTPAGVKGRGVTVLRPDYELLKEEVRPMALRAMLSDPDLRLKLLETVAPAGEGISN